MSNKPVQTFREGTIAASVWERAGSHGKYFELTLSRSFRRNLGPDIAAGTGQSGFGYSPCFRARDVDALKQCIKAAAAWIRTQAAEGEVTNSEPEVETVTDMQDAEPCEL